jgi:ABC-type transporter Mla MlaB component
MSEESIKLEGVVNIAKAEVLFHEMEEVIRLSHPAKIYAPEVTRVDTAVLQLIASFIAHMNNVGASVEWCGVSEELLAAAKLLGMEQALMLRS